mmetsp:Transcript_28684/g.95216  ORF Transcript_28684/g.95216 Transcript_28684/m.95216 type:complete len:545 (-) Transcript_28684:122-1756(-)
MTRSRRSGNKATPKAAQQGAKELEVSPVGGGLKGPPGLALLRPPGLDSPSTADHAEEDDEVMEEEEPIDPDDFKDVLSGLPLPPSLASDFPRLDRFRDAVRSCIEGLYCDRVTPTLAEIHRRIRSLGCWEHCEVQAITRLCARAPDVYKLTPPLKGHSIRILLRKEPAWFCGWVDPATPDTFSAAVWQDFGKMLENPSLTLKGCLIQVVTTLKNQGLPQGLRDLTIGELRNLVHLAVDPKGKSVLTYDPLNGSRMLPSAVAARRRAQPPGPAQQAAEPVAGPNPFGGSPDTLLSASPPGVQQQEGSGHAPPTAEGYEVDHLASAQYYEDQTAFDLADALRMRPLPHGVGCSPDEMEQRLQVVQACMETLYRDRIEPTLGNIQQRLLDFGWSFEEVQCVPFLCAREPAMFEFISPEDDEPCRIFLQTPPCWFDGWVCVDMSEDPYPPTLWEALGDFLNSNASMVFHGGIAGAAAALQQLGLPCLQCLSLGELQDVVGRAITEHGLLAFSGNDIRPRRVRLEQALHGDAAGDREAFPGAFRLSAYI